MTIESHNAPNGNRNGTVLSTTITWLKNLFIFRDSEWETAYAVISQLIGDLAQRVLLSLLVLLILVFVGETFVAVIWFFAILVNETIEVIANNRVVASQQPSRKLLILHCLNWVCGGTIWTSTSLYLIASGPVAEQFLGVVMLVGAMLHVVFHYADWLKGMFYAACPLMIGLLVLPFVAEIEGASMQQAVVSLIAYGGLLFYVFYTVYQNLRRHEAFKQAIEASASASDSKSTFLANMSHEIRTPMNGVMGMTKLLKRTELSEQQKELVDIIDDSGETLLRVIGDVLDLSKVEAGRLELEREPFILDDVLKTIIATAELKAAEKGLKFEYVKPEETDICLVGDEIRIRQIVNNLISNAVKFTETGSVALKVFLTANTRRDYKYLIAEVSDTGPGISPENAKWVFRPFVQTDPSLSRKESGAGLGLTISRQLAELMGGNIRLISQEGRGATFIFTLEIEMCDDTCRTRMAKASHNTLSSEDQQSFRVLVVEDHKQNQLVIRKMLEAIGIEPIITSSGEEALALFRSTQFDIILMDIQMPGMSGIEALKHIRDIERQAELARTPIVAVTANAMKHQVDQYLWEGFDDHLPKPIDLEKLVMVISDVANTQNED